MTTGPEDYGNAAAKTDDRFASQLGMYRSGSRRDSSAVLPIDGIGIDGVGLDGGVDAPVPRNGSVPTLDRIGSPLDTANPIASSLPTPKLVEPDLSDLDPLGESGFSTDNWFDSGSSSSLADHPLLRGLLFELPPKGSIPAQDWLDRWFEAARSILELLYAQEAGARR